MDERRALRLGLLIAAAYMAARFLVYRAMPVLDGAGQGVDWSLWFRRDALMSLPRLAGLAACLAVMAKAGPWESWGWHGRAPARPLALAASVVLVYALFFLPERAAIYTPAQKALGWATTLPVALFEEACFRGLLYVSLSRLWSPRPAALLSALLFAAYHWQAQPVQDWPSIFCIGVVWAAALESGLGLPWLVLAHELADALFFHIGEAADVEGWAAIKALQLLLFALLAAVALRRMPARRA